MLVLKLTPVKQSSFKIFWSKELKSIILEASSFKLEGVSFSPALSPGFWFFKCGSVI